jgi:parallel beta-helix repeat protein
MKNSKIRKVLALSIIVLFVGSGFVSLAIGITKEKIPIENIGSRGYIQDLIDNATDGDTIYIPSGNYYENIDINKSISLIGEDRNTTFIRKCYIIADWVNFSDFTTQGITISFCSYSTISDNIILHNKISLTHCSNNTVIGNKISNYAYCGIKIGYQAHGNIIENNIIDDSNYGIYVEWMDMGGPKDNIIVNNTLIRGGIYTRPWLMKDNIILNNTVNGKPLVFLSDESNLDIDNAGQILLKNCDNITIQNQDLSNTTMGILIGNSKDCLISNNFICSNIFQGLWIENSKDINISFNKIFDNNYGIKLAWSSDIIIFGNDIFENNYKEGIYLENNFNITIKCNNISSNHYGIYLMESNFNNITDNILLDNGISLYIWYSNGNNIDENYIFERWGIALIARYSNNNKIKSNYITKCMSGGASLINSDNNIISNNNLINNSISVTIFNRSSYNTIINNNINFNDYMGISISDACNNTIECNNFTDNYYALSIQDYKFECKNNEIYHNNFINNYQNGYDLCENNTWDDGEYGNYWYDYEEKYPKARKKPFKCVWDTPYEITGENSIDRYPLINQWPKTRIRTITRTQTTVHPILYWFFERFPMLEKLLSLLL